MKKVFFVLSLLACFPTLGRACTLNVQGIVSSDVTPWLLGYVKRIHINIWKRVAPMTSFQ